MGNCTICECNLRTLAGECVACKNEHELAELRERLNTERETGEQVGEKMVWEKMHKQCGHYSPSGGDAPDGHWCMHEEFYPNDWADEGGTADCVYENCPLMKGEG